MDPRSLALFARAAFRERAKGLVPQTTTIIMESVLVQHPSFEDGWRRQMDLNDAVQNICAGQGLQADCSYRSWQQPTIIDA
eukprot:16144819-Heterocapsa_arctica.AAC.1